MSNILSYVVPPGVKFTAQKDNNLITKA